MKIWTKFGLAGILACGLSSCEEERIAFSLKNAPAQLTQYSTAMDIELARAHKTLESAVKDNVLDVAEQKAYLGHLRGADEACKSYTKLSSRFPERSAIAPLKMPEEDSILYELVKKNIEGFDSGEPALQAELRKNYQKIKVEPYESPAEKSAEEISEAVMNLASGILSSMGN